MKLKIFLIGLILLLTLSVVSAADNSTELSIDDSQDDIISDGMAVEKTFDDLQTEINNAQGGNVELNGTYVGSDKTININSDAVIDGQGITTIDGNKSNKVLFSTYLGTTVVFKNIKFMNANSGVILADGNLVVDNCTFVSNSGDNLIHTDWYTTCLINNSNFENNQAKGCIIDLYSQDVTIANSNFTKNKDPIIKIGADQTTAIIDNINLINSTLKSDGIYVSDSKKFTLKNSNINNNKFSSVFLRQFGKNADISNCNFTNNEGDLMIAMSNIDNCRFINNNPSYQMINVGSNGNFKPTIKNSIFKNNKIVNGNPVQSTLLLVGGDVDVLSCEFADNTAPYGGAIFFAANGKIDKCSFVNNNAKTGGAIYVYSTNLVLTNNKFTNNKATSYNDVYGYFSLELPKSTYTYGEKITVKVKDKLTGKYVSGMKIDFVFWKNEVHSGKPISSVAKTFTKLLKVGKYVAVIHLAEEYDLLTYLKKTITVKKAPTTVKAPKVKFKHKKSKYFKITVKSGKNPVKKVVLKVKIDKKVHKIKTNAKGIAKFNTKKLKVGKHKVVISSGNANYAIKGKSVIKIKK